MLKIFNYELKYAVFITNIDINTDYERSNLWWYDKIFGVMHQQSIKCDYAIVVFFFFIWCGSMSGWHGKIMTWYFHSIQFKSKVHERWRAHNTNKSINCTRSILMLYICPLNFI